MKGSTLGLLVLLPQAHLLEISVVDICGVAWNGRSEREEEGGKVSGV